MQASSLQSENLVKPRPLGRREIAAQQKLSDILTQATRLFAEKGYHGTAVPEVAAAAGVGAGTIYRYFENKEHLVNGVFMVCKQNLAEYMERDLGANDQTRLVQNTIERKFAILWKNLCDFALENPEQFCFLELQEHTKYLDKKSKQFERNILAPVRLFIIQGKAQGVIKPIPAMTLIAMVWGVFVGLFKAETYGYTSLSQSTLEDAGRMCWQMISEPNAD